jgi:hypothetical protein
MRGTGEAQQVEVDVPLLPARTGRAWTQGEQLDRERHPSSNELTAAPSLGRGSSAVSRVVICLKKNSSPELSIIVPFVGELELTHKRQPVPMDWEGAQERSGRRQ